MRKVVSILLVASLALASLFVLDSCSTSKKATNRRGDDGIAVNAPDYKQIKRAVETKGSEFYYPELLRRFQSADTTMTIEQNYYFYYGTATRSDYQPYKSDRFAELKKALSGDTLTDANWRQAAEIVEKQLKDDPTNLRFHRYKQIVYSNLYGEESVETINAYIQVLMLYSAIASTGDGKTPETAFHVICVPDEYALMEMFGVIPNGQALIEKQGRSYDRMDLEENEFGMEALYFDITVCMKALDKMFRH